MIPVRLKFGENGRIFVVLIVAACFAMAGGISAVVKSDVASALVNRVEEMSSQMLIFILYAAAVAVLAVSWLVSVHVMEKKAL